MVEDLHAMNFLSLSLSLQGAGILISTQKGSCKLKVITWGWSKLEAFIVGEVLKTTNNFLNFL